jgi:hypothetical protein
MEGITGFPVEFDCIQASSQLRTMPFLTFLNLALRPLIGEKPAVSV